jgi:3-hydroxyisobutyrate dehydrogenase-like beta-hydroxyacid dehydrogenase
MPVTRVGLLGTGRMGSAMVRALARGDTPIALTLWNRTPAPAAALAEELGAAVAATPADLAATVDVALTMVADERAVRDLFEGPSGLLAGARPGVVLVDLSTVAPATILALAPEARARGAGILDSPVSGSVGLAERGQLTLMVGGDAADLERARPVLEALAARIFHMGALGNGAAMKLAVNGVIFGLNQAVAEALVLAETAGVDRALAYEVLASSAVGAPYVGYKRDAFLDPDGTPTAFALDLADKDLGLITGFARALGVPSPQVAVNHQLIREAAADGHGDRDFSTVAMHLRQQVTGRKAAVAEEGGGAERP